MNEREAVRAYFEREAVSFDRRYEGSLPDRLLRPAIYRRTALAVRTWRAAGWPPVLDVGCGSARTALALCHAGCESVTGIDFSARMIALGRDLVAAGPHRDRITLETADFVTWQPDRTWPFVLALGVLEYFADLPTTVAQLARFTRRTLAFTVRRFTPVRGSVRAVHNRLAGCPIHFTAPAQITAACTAAGFAEVEILDGGPGFYWVTATR